MRGGESPVVRTTCLGVPSVTHYQGESLWCTLLTALSRGMWGQVFFLAVLSGKSYGSLRWNNVARRKRRKREPANLHLNRRGVLNTRTGLPFVETLGTEVWGGGWAGWKCVKV